MLSLLVGLLAGAVEVQKAFEKKVEAKSNGARRDATRRDASRRFPTLVPVWYFFLLVCLFVLMLLLLLLLFSLVAKATL